MSQALISTLLLHDVETKSGLVKRELQSGDRWHKGTDAPDVLWRRDFIQHPGAADKALHDYVSRGIIPLSARISRLPKASGSDYRKVMFLDPLGEVIYRRLVGKLLPTSIPANVLSSRSERFGSSWRTANWTHALSERKMIEQHWRADKVGEGVLYLDVKNHYPSIQMDALTGMLNAEGASSCTVACVMTFLRMLHNFPGAMNGIPVGPEASAILGTLSLRPLDRVFTSVPIDWYRWVDDVRAPTSRAMADHLMENGTKVIHRNGLAFNDAKSGYVEWSIAEQDLTLSADGEDVWSDEGQDSTIDSILEAVATGDAKAVPRALGLMRRGDDDSAIEILAENRWLMHKIPRQAARYLSQFVERNMTANDLLLSESLMMPSNDRELFQIHCISELRRRGLHADKDVGQRFLNLVDSWPIEEFRALRAQCLAAYSTSNVRPREKRRVICDRVREYREPDSCRALLAGLQSTTVNRVESSLIRDLVTRAPELGPVCTSILSD